MLQGNVNSYPTQHSHILPVLLCAITVLTLTKADQAPRKTGGVCGKVTKADQAPRKTGGVCGKVTKADQAPRKTGGVCGKVTYVSKFITVNISPIC